jgi:hypothetical protein
VTAGSIKEKKNEILSNPSPTQTLKKKKRSHLQSNQSKVTRAKRARDVPTQVAAHKYEKYEALSSNPNTAKRTKKQKNTRLKGLATPCGSWASSQQHHLVRM